MGIADNLRRLRKAAGLSQAELAKKSGVTQQLISQIERGENTSTTKLPALAAAIGCKVAQIDPSYSEGTAAAIAVPLLSLELMAKVARSGASAMPEDVERIPVGGLGPGEWVAVATIDDALDRVAPEGALLIANLAETALERCRFYLIYDEEQGTVFCRRYFFDPPVLEPWSLQHRFKTMAMRRTLRPIAKVEMVISRL